MYYLRRCAWLGDVVFRQPLLAHEVWLNEAERCVSDDWMSQLACRAFICCTEPCDLPPSTSKQKIRESVEAFIPRLGEFTQAQIAAAVLYVTVGNDWRVGEEAPKRKSESNNYLHLGPEFSSAVGMIHNGVAIGVGLTIQDAMNLPRSQFEAIVERHLNFESAYDQKKVFSDNEDDYFRALDNIRARLKEEKGNG